MHWADIYIYADAVGLATLCQARSGKVKLGKVKLAVSTLVPEVHNSPHSQNPLQYVNQY